MPQDTNQECTQTYFECHVWAQVVLVISLVIIMIILSIIAYRVIKSKKRKGQFIVKVKAIKVREDKLEAFSRGSRESLELKAAELNHSNSISAANNILNEPSFEIHQDDKNPSNSYGSASIALK